MAGFLIIYAIRRMLIDPRDMILHEGSMITEGSESVAVLQLYGYIAVSFKVHADACKDRHLVACL